MDNGKEPGGTTWGFGEGWQAVLIYCANIVYLVVFWGINILSIVGSAIFILAKFYLSIVWLAILIVAIVFLAILILTIFDLLWCWQY